MHHDLLDRTRELIAGCGCEHGCPTCVGPIGETGRHAKAVALALLAALGSRPPARVAAEALAQADALAKADAPF